MTFPWHRYSKKLAARIDVPRWAGAFTEKDTEGRNVKLVTGSDGAKDLGNAITLYWLVDLEEGMIVDVKYQAFAQSALIGAAEAACELLCGKNYDQAMRLTADLIDRHLRDRSDTPAFPDETSGHLNLVIGAIEEAAQKCVDIPLGETYVTPAPLDIGEVLENGYPGFKEMPKKKKLRLIDQTLIEHVKPYIELDDGGIHVLDLIDKEVLIAYEGNCTTCHAATGSTLSYIQHVIQSKVHPELIVVPEL